jgi:hypothetical protein
VKMDRESKELSLAGLKMMSLCLAEIRRRERVARQNPYAGIAREPRLLYRVPRGEFGLLRMVRDALRGWRVPLR